MLVFFFYPTMTPGWIYWELCWAVLLWNNLITRVIMFKGNQLMMKNTLDLKKREYICIQTERAFLGRLCWDETNCIPHTGHVSLNTHISISVKYIKPSSLADSFCTGDPSICHREQFTSLTFNYFGNMNINRSETIQKSTQTELFLGQCRASDITAITSNSETHVYRLINKFEELHLVWHGSIPLFKAWISSCPWWHWEWTMDPRSCWPMLIALASDDWLVLCGPFSAWRVEKMLPVYS